jgi:predicted translin family RNA/ssDNA-binding protein
VTKLDEADYVHVHDEEAVALQELEEANCATAMMKRRVYIIGDGEELEEVGVTVVRAGGSGVGKLAGEVERHGKESTRNGRIYMVLKNININYSLALLLIKLISSSSKLKPLLIF